MVFGGILAINDFTPSIDGIRCYLGIRLESTIKRWFLMVFRDKLTVNHHFMVINGIWAFYDFTPLLDGKR